MLPPQPIRAARWLPDLYDPDNPGYAVVQNALPHSQGFYSINGYAPNTAAVGGLPIGSVWGRDVDNTAFNIVGADNGIYVQQTDRSWSQQLPLDIDSIESWSFTQFGSRIIAVTPGQVPYYVDLDDNIYNDANSDDGYFRVLPGLPPRASRCATLRDFVVLGDIVGHPRRVQWSGFNNSETWNPSAVTQAGFQDLPGRAGAVQQIVPGERGLIFQENSIHRMTHVGPGPLFQFDEVERNRGTQAPDSVCWTGDRVFYFSPAGFFEYQVSGEKSVSIGHNQVDRWVIDNVSTTRTMRGVIDATNKVALWSINLTAALDFDAILVYRWDIETWSIIYVNHTLLSIYPSSGVSLDSTELDTFYGSNIDNPDAQTSFDSALWRPGALALHVFGTDQRRGGFDGAPLPAVFETGYRPIIPGALNYHMNAVRPLLDRRGQLAGGTTQVTVQSKNDLSDPDVPTTPALVRANGRADVRESGRYASLRLTTTGGFAGMSGFIIHARAKGGRG